MISTSARGTSFEGKHDMKNAKKKKGGSGWKECVPLAAFSLLHLLMGQEVWKLSDHQH